MALEVSIQECKDHIRVEVSGERTSGNEKEDAINLWTQVVEVCRKSEVKKILVISTLTGRVPAVKTYDIAGNPEAFGWSREYKLALVDLDENSRQHNLFAEDVAVNRGFHVKVFDNEEDAKDWLL